MSDDIQLQKALLASYSRSSSSSSHGSSSNYSSLRSASRTPLVSVSVSSRGYPALEKEGIMPARKNRTSRAPSNYLRRGEGKTKTGVKNAPKAAKPTRMETASTHEHDYESAVVNNLTKRFGKVDVSDHIQNSGNGALAWRRIFGVGSFKTASCGNHQNKGVLECITSSEPSVLQYVADERTDKQGFKALAQDSEGIRVGMKFKCAHAAPASNHVPAFHLLLCVGREAQSKSFLALYVNCKQREFALDTFQIRKDTCKIHRLDTFPFREVRPGVYNSLVVDINYETLSLSLVCNDNTVLDKHNLEQYEYCRNAQVQAALGLSISNSKLEWDALELKASSNSVLETSISRFTHSDMSLVQAIEEDMLEMENMTSFDDIASLKVAKQLLNEAVALPLIIPEFFVGIREPWKGVLLFGPPGTGKTLLAKAVASMSNVRFFNCSSSTMTSKWRGESEKLVKVLFQMARHYAPSIIFFDEVDALVTRRGHDGEHEASRRFKSELLSQMDGITSDFSSGKSVMVLATTNCPWDIDEAMRRRLEKRIYIPLPDMEARKEMFKIYIQSLKLDKKMDLETLAVKTEGFSGADLKLLCRDASMMPMRRVIENKTPAEIVRMKEEGALEKCPLLQQDFTNALKKVQPSVSQADVKKYEMWNKEFASA